MRKVIFARALDAEHVVWCIETSGVPSASSSETKEGVRGAGVHSPGVISLLEASLNCDWYPLCAAYMNLNSKRPEPALTPLERKLFS